MKSGRLSAEAVLREMEQPVRSPPTCGGLTEEESSCDFSDASRPSGGSRPSRASPVRTATPGSRKSPAEAAARHTDPGAGFGAMEDDVSSSSVTGGADGYAMPGNRLSLAEPPNTPILAGYSSPAQVAKQWRAAASSRRSQYNIPSAAVRREPRRGEHAPPSALSGRDSNIRRRSSHSSISSLPFDLVVEHQPADDELSGASGSSRREVIRAGSSIPQHQRRLLSANAGDLPREDMAAATIQRCWMHFILCRPARQRLLTRARLRRKRQREREREELRVASVNLIQAVWRGSQCRGSLGELFDCDDC